jgi:hypothetical protein
MTMQGGSLGNCKKEEPWGERPLNVLNTREKIMIKN